MTISSLVSRGLGAWSSTALLLTDGLGNFEDTTSLSASPATLAANSTGNAVMLTGTGTSWTPGTPGAPTFTIASTGIGAAITAQAVASATSATLTVNAGTTGLITITDPSTGDTANITVSAAAGATDFSLTPSSQTTQTGTATGPFTITPNGIPSSSTLVALSDGGAGGVFTPASLTFTTATAQTFTYTPAFGNLGFITLTATASGGFSAAHIATVNSTRPGTFDFDPPVSDIILEAFERCEIYAPSITQNHMRAARRSVNLELQTWSNRGVNLWEVMPFTVQLVAGQAVYYSGTGVSNIPLNIEMMLDIYYSQINGAGNGVNIDRILRPIGRSDYAAYPNKLQQGTPTVYWYQKLESPTLTLWEVPLTGWPTYAVSGFALMRIADAAVPLGQTPNIPYRAIDTLCAGLAARLALKFRPQVFPLLNTLAKESWVEFSSADREDAPIQVTPDMSGFYR